MGLHWIPETLNGSGQSLLDGGVCAPQSLLAVLQSSINPLWLTCHCLSYKLTTSQTTTATFWHFSDFFLPSEFVMLGSQTTLKRNITTEQRPPQHRLQTGRAWDISIPGALLGPSLSPRLSPCPSPPQAGGMAHSRQDMAMLKQKGTSPSCQQLLISALA